MNQIYTHWMRALLILSLSISKLALAVDVPSYLSGLSAGIVGKNISRTPTTPGQTTSTSAFVPPQAQERQLPPEMYQIKLTLNKVTFRGNKAISSDELLITFKPFLHHQITLAKLQELVDKVSQQYEKKGYFLSKAFLPPQQIANGAVQVTVVEGFVSKIQVQGLKSKRLTAFIQKYERNIVNVKPVKLKSLERLILVLNDIPGFTVKSVLAPDPKVPLGSIVTLVTEYKPFQATASRDNYQTVYIGPDETTLWAAENSVLLAGGTMSGRFLSSDQYKQLHFYELKYDQLLGTNGLLLTFDGYQTNTNPQFILAPLELMSKSLTGNVTLSYPIIRSRLRNLSIQAQLDSQTNTSNILGQRLYEDEIRDISFNVNYFDSWLKGDNTAFISFEKGLNIWGADKGQFRSRAGATPEYFKIAMTVSRNQNINHLLSLYAQATGQYADRILYSAETFSFGGPYMGRGYDWAQFIGDQGFAAKTEFRVTTMPGLKYLQQVQFYAFYDVGVVYSKIPHVGRASGASSGIGLRSAVMPHINFETFAGVPLTTPNATQILKGQSGFRPEWYFQVSAYI